MSVGVIDAERVGLLAGHLHDREGDPRGAADRAGTARGVEVAGRHGALSGWRLIITARSNSRAKPRNRAITALSRVLSFSSAV